MIVSMPFDEFMTVTILVAGAVIGAMWLGNWLMWRRQQRRNILRRLKEHS
jgi:cytochrome oxidase assembly protein ShyY1